jgi:hypothetical protein
MSAWLDECRPTPRGPVLPTDEAGAAVRALGPEAVPTLLARLSAPDSPIRRHAKIVLEWRLKLPVRTPTNQEQRMVAMYGFRALGLAAESAFPGSSPLRSIRRKSGRGPMRSTRSPTPAR